MIKSPYIKCLLLVLLLIVFNASAESKATLHKFAGYEMGYGTFSFDEKLDHKIVFPVANLTAGLAYKRFSYVLNLSGSLSDADISEEEQLGHGSRRDLDFTVGYQINKKISAFVGYKDGASKLTLSHRDPAATDAIPGGTEEYNQQGLYAGVNLNWAFKNAGKLAFSVAYAQLDVVNRMVADEIYKLSSGDEFDFDDINSDSTGTSRGFSYTLNYTLPIKGSLLFRARLKINQYKQDVSGQQLNGDTASTTIIHYEFEDVTERSTMLLVGVTKVF